MLTYSDAILLIIPIYIIVLIIGVRKKYSFLKHGLLFLGSIYITLLIAVTLFPLPISKEFIELRRLDVISTNNFIPFKSIYDLILNTNISTIIRNLIGNILLLIPFGLLVPILFKKINTYKKIFVSSLLFSILIELTQLIISSLLGFNYKIVDIDDIILNVIGGIMGYISYKLICIILEPNKEKNKI